MNTKLQKEIVDSLQAFRTTATKINKFIESCLTTENLRKQVESLQIANSAGDLELRETIQYEEAWKKAAVKLKEENARLNEQFLKAHDFAEKYWEVRVARDNLRDRLVHQSTTITGLREEIKNMKESVRRTNEVTIGVGNGRGNLYLHGSYEATKVCQEKLLRMERAEAALHRIRIVGGRVCPTYEGCTHVWCQSSYDAWAIADRTLRRIK